MPGEKNPEKRGFLSQALLASLLMHGALLGALAPWIVNGAAERLAAAPLQGRLLPAPVIAATAAETAGKVGRAKPAGAMAATQPTESSPSVPLAAVAPAPTFARAATPQGASETGGAAHRQATHANVAPTAEVREQGPDAAGLRQYRLALAGEARRLRNYPEAARRAGLSGTAEVRVAVESGGAVRRADLTRTSGHVLLDTAAVEMLREAAGRAALPDSLRGLNFAVLLPVVFEVED